MKTLQSFFRAKLFVINLKKIIFLFLLTIFSCNLAHAYTSLQNDATSWSIRTSAANNNWQGVAYGNGTFVSVANSGATNQVMTSPDGITWTARNAAAAAAWEAVTYANGLFVAVAGASSNGFRVMTSPDGITWTLRATPADNQWKAITYGNGLFVALAVTGTNNRVMTSPDGINWTLRTSPADYNWTSVTYANGLFVAIAYTTCSTSCVMTSSDGINWTLRTSTGGGDIWNEVTYGNGLFVAVSESSPTYRVMTSPDGINWTGRSVPAEAWQSVTYSSSSGLFVAVAGAGSSANRIMTSSDGITWAQRASPVSNNWEYVTSMGGIFVSVALTGTGNRVMTSHPTTSTETAGGIITTTYTTSSETDTNSILILAGTSTQVVARPVDGVSYSVGNIIGTSTVICIDTTITPNTTDSCTATGLTNEQPYHLAIFTKDNSGNYTPVGVVPTGSPATPTPKLLLGNGTNPSNVDRSPGTSPIFVNSFTFQTDVGTGVVSSVTLEFAEGTASSTSLIEITNDAGTTVYGATTTTNFASTTTILLTTNTLTANTTLTQYKIRITPKSYENLPPGKIYSVTARVSGFASAMSTGGTDASGATINIGYFGPAPASHLNNNVLDWAVASSSNPSAALKSIVHGEGIFVAVSNTSTTSGIVTSYDGVNWVTRTKPNTNQLSSVTYGNNIFVAVSTNGTGNRVMTSPDGITWTARTSAADNNWQSVTYGNGLFVAVACGVSSTSCNSTAGNRVMTSPDGITWTQRVSAANNQWLSVTYGNGLFVATANTGTGNRVMTSPDGITWTSRTSAADHGWNSVVYANGLFVAVSIASTIMTSPDGITWTLRTSPSGGWWSSVAYGNGLFIAVANPCNSSGCIMTSPDGITWSAQTSPLFDSWTSITYGNGIFIAVSSATTNNRVMVSSPYITSQPRNTQITTSYTHASSTSVNSILILAGTSTQVVARPVDGVSYSVGNIIGTSTVICIDTTITPNTTDSCTATGLTNGQQYHVAVFAKNSLTQYSPFGVIPSGTPTTVNPLLTLGNGSNPSNSTVGPGTSPVFVNSFTFQTDVGTGVVSSVTLEFAEGTASSTSLIEITNDAGTTVYGATTTTNFATTITIPLTTNTLTANTSLTQYKVRITPKSQANLPPATQGQLYAVTARVTDVAISGFNKSLNDSLSGTITIDNKGVDVVTTSSLTPNGDGTLPFITRTLPQAISLNSAVYGNGIFVAVGTGGIASSFDGVTWTIRTEPTDNDWRSIAYGNGIFVAVASSGTGNRVMTSSDGITWTARTSAVDNFWMGVTYGNGLFVAVSQDGTGNRVMTSPDGITWTARTSAADNNWKSVTYGNGLFVAVGSLGTGNRVMTSPDGITWTARTSAADYTWNSVAYGNGKFVAVGAQADNAGGTIPGVVMTSSDGINWALYSPNLGNNWTSVAYGGGIFIATSAWASNKFMTSVDGVTWIGPSVNNYETSISGPWQSIAYGGGMFAAFAITAESSMRTLGSFISSTPYTESLNNKITTQYTLPTDSDVHSILILAGTSTQVVARPLDGVSYSVGNIIGTSTVICIDNTITPNTTDSCTATGLTNGQQYHVAVFLRDSYGNYSPNIIIPSGSPATPNPGITLGNGSNPSNTTVGPGTSPIFVNSFTLQTDVGTGVVSSVTLEFAEGTASSTSLIEITNDAGTVVYGATTTTDFASTITIPLTTNTLTANTSLTQYKVRITPKSHANLPPPNQGQLYAVTARVVDFASTMNTVGNDISSGVVTIDNLSVFIATGASQWSSQPSAADYQWDSVAYGNGIFAAVADSGTGNRIMTSPDGITWTLQTTPADYTWKHIAFGNGIFVAVSVSGVGNRVMTSTDGVVWTLRNTPADNNWHFVKYVNNLFVALAYNATTSSIMTSPDGINWTIRTTVADNNVWTGVAYGNGTYVAVSWSGSANRVMTSPDGVTWTGQSVPSLTQAWDDVAYGNGLFVAVGNSGAGDRVMTSPDGVTWTLRPAASNNNWTGILFVDGLFVAVSETGTGNRVMTSPNGITWTSQVSAADNQWRGLAYGNNTFVAVAKSGTGNRVMISRDLTTKTVDSWVLESTPTDNNWTSVVYGQNKFVAVANTGANNRAMYSPNGQGWTTSATLDNNWNSIAYGNGIFVAVADSGDTYRVMTSPDGITWTPRILPLNLPFTSVAYGNGLFVIVGEAGGDKKALTSTDGINWTPRVTPNDTNKWKSVTYGNGLFVAVANTGEGSRVMTSPDGVTWTSRNGITDNEWQSVTYGSGLFVAVASSGNGNRVMTSPDGINWTLRTTPADNSWVSVTYGGGLFVAVAKTGSGNRVMTSVNGTTWSLKPSPDNSWNAVTYGNNSFVSVGASNNSESVMVPLNQPPLIISGNTQNTIMYTPPAGEDITSILVLRSTSQVSDTPQEGSTYSLLSSVGASTVVCVDNTIIPFVTDSCTDTSLTNGQNYHYAIFAKDVYGNYSRPVVPVGSPATPQTVALLNQAAYQFFASSTSATPGTALAAQNALGTLTNSGQIFRMRMTLGVSTSLLATSSRPFKLQFSPKVGTCDASFTGEDYKDINSSTPIAYYNVPTIVSGAVLGSQADITHGGSNIVDQTYNESNNFTNSQASVSVGDYAKFDFSLIDNNAPSNTSYCIRAIGADGSLLSSYSAIPEIVTATQQVSISGYRLRRDDGDEINATYFTTENGVLSSGFVAGDKLRIRFSLANQTSVTARKAYQLEYSSGSCVVWSQVPRPIDVTNQHFRMETSPFVADNSTTTHSSGMSVPGGRTFVPGRVQTFNSATLPIVLQANEYTELEYSVRSMGNVTPNTPYCFRLSNLGLTNDFLYTFTPQLTPFSKFLRAQAGGGGGGGASATIINIEEAAKVATTTVTGGTVSGGATTTVDVPVATSTTQQSTTTPTRRRGGSTGNVGFLYNNTLASASQEGMVLGETAVSMCTNMQTRMLYGSTDSTTEGEVSQLQYFLKTKGYFNAKVTGNFFEITENAVKEFQKDNNLIVTGIVGKPTREKMQQLGCVSLSRN